MSALTSAHSELGSARWLCPMPNWLGQEDALKRMARSASRAIVRVTRQLLESEGHDDFRILRLQLVQDAAHVHFGPLDLRAAEVD